MIELIFQEETYKIRGAIFEVYREMGNGFLEAVYQECLQNEFKKQDIAFVSQKDLSLYYKGDKLKQTYKPDFICYEKIIVELKATTAFADDHRSQVHNYLKATKLQLGLLVNFGSYPNVEIERIIK